MKIIIVNPHHYAPCYGIALHRIFDSVEALQKLTLPFDAQRWYIFTDAGIYLYLDHAAARRA